MNWLMTFWIVVVLTGLFVAGLRRTTLMEYERGVRYFRGRFDRVVGPGVHWYAPFFVRLERVDIRPQHVSIAGQEVLSADGVALKVSLAVNFEVADPEVALNKAKDYSGALHLELQIAVREIIGGSDVDALLTGRDALGARMLEKCVPRGAALGVRLISVDVKDLMVPGKLKEMFAQVVAARKAGLAALEKARGETAALRHLSNAAPGGRSAESAPASTAARADGKLGEHGDSGNAVASDGDPGLRWRRKRRTARDSAQHGGIGRRLTRDTLAIPR